MDQEDDLRCMQSPFGEETQPRTLYVGNLDVQMTEEFLLVLFSQIGEVKGCKIIQETIGLLFLLINIVSGVLWNMRQKGTKVRLRPPRHQQQVIYMSPQGKSDLKPLSSHQRRIPYPMPPARPQRPHPPMHSPGPPPVAVYPTVSRPMVHYMKPTYPQKMMHPPKLISHPPHREVVGESKHPMKHHPPAANLVEPPMFNPPVDSNQHGYMSPSYTGWKPIARPFYSYKSQHEVQESKGDTYIPPSTESSYNENLMMNTLFRDNVKHIKPHNSVRLKPEYSENRGITIALPQEVGESVQIPSSVFFDPPYHKYQHPVNLVISQSQEKPVAVKPFPKFNSKPKSGTPENNSQNSTESTPSNTQLLSKFKISRPRLRVPSKSKDTYNNDPEIEGLQHVNLPKVTFSPGSIGSAPDHQNVSNQVSSNSEIDHFDSFPPKLNRVKTRLNTKNKEFSPDALVDVDTLTNVLGQRQKSTTSHVVSEKEKFNHFPQEFSNPTVKQDTNDTFSEFSFPPTYPDEYRTAPNFHNDFGRNVQQSVTSSSTMPGPSPSRHKPRNELRHTTSVPERGRRRKPKNQITTRVPIPTTSTTTSEKPIYPTEFFIPPGFSEASSGAHHPVSFMTMPNSEPHVIHHDSYNGYNQRTPHVYNYNGIKSDAEFRDNHFGSISSPSNHYPKNKYQYTNNVRNRPESVYQSSPPTTTYPSSYNTPSSTPLNYVSYAPQQKTNPSLDYSYRPFHLNEPSTTPATSYEMSRYTPAFGSSYHTSHMSDYFRPITGSSEETQTTPYTHTYHTEPTNTYMIQNSHPVPNQVLLSPNEYERIPMEYINDLSPILINDDNNLYHYPYSASQNHPASQEIPQTTQPIKPFFTYHNDYYQGQGQSGESMSSGLNDINKASSSNIQPHLLQASPPSLQPSSSTVRLATSTSIPEPTSPSPSTSSDIPQQWSKLIVDVGKTKYANEVTRKADDKNTTSASISNTVSKSIQKASYSKPVLLVRNSTQTENAKEEDALDSNTPRTVNFKNNFNLTSIQAESSNHSTSIHSSESESISSSVSGQKPSMRKRRPGILGRRKVFSARLKGKEETKTNVDPPVTTHRPRSRNPAYRENFESLRAYNKANTLTRISSDNSKRITSKQSIRSRIGISPTEPTKKKERSSSVSSSSSPPTEPVTYSESQWFRIKSVENEEKLGRTVDLGFKEPETFDSKSHDTIENQISSTTSFP